MSIFPVFSDPGGIFRVGFLAKIGAWTFLFQNLWNFIWIQNLLETSFGLHHHFDGVLVELRGARFLIDLVVILMDAIIIGIELFGTFAEVNLWPFNGSLNGSHRNQFEFSLQTQILSKLFFCCFCLFVCFVLCLFVSLFICRTFFFSWKKCRRPEPENKFWAERECLIESLPLRAVPAGLAVAALTALATCGQTATGRGRQQPTFFCFTWLQNEDLQDRLRWDHLCLYLSYSINQY